MPSFNQAEYIKEAINSVLLQNYEQIELIVADGGSNDGTIEILKEMQTNDPRLKWFSQQDNGPADAVNKALVKSKGTIIGWLNSDDKYKPDIIKKIVTSFNSNKKIVMLYGHAEHIDSFGNLINRYPTLPPNTPINEFANGCFICQPSVFFKRTVYLLEGKLDQSLKTSFDFDYWLRVFLKFPGRIGFIDSVLAQSRLHKNCITLKMRRLVTIEGMKVVAKYLDYAPGHWLESYLNELLLSSEKNNDGWCKHINELLKDTADYMCEKEYQMTKKQLYNAIK